MSNGYSQHFKKLSQNKAKIQKTKPKTKVRRKAFPIHSLIAMVVIMGGSGWLYMNLDKIEEKLDKIEIKFLGKAEAQVTNVDKPGEQKLPTENKIEENSSIDKTKVNIKSEPENQNLNPEEVTLFNKLEERRQQLDQRESDLKKLDEELHNQKLMLEEKLKQLEELRKGIATQLDDRIKTDDSKVGKLVEMYSNMKPIKAAKVMETINEDLAIEVLKKMKKKEAADILNMMEQTKAQKLSEKFAGYRND